MLLRLLDPEELAKYNGMTPTTLDFLGNCTDGVYSCPYVIDDGNEGTEGRRPIVYASGTTETITAGKSSGTRPRAFVSYPSIVLSYDMNRTVGNIYDPRPRGSWRLNAIYGGSPDAKQSVKVTDNVVYVI